MTTQHDDQNHDPFETNLRRSAAGIHPRAAFVQGLRRELNSREMAPRGGLVRRFLPQAAALAALAGLVALALFLTPHLLRVPGAGMVQQGTTVPGESPIISLDGLPEGALARLGLGQILSLDTAADGSLAVASTLGVCLYDNGHVRQWCQQIGSPYGLGWAMFNPTGDWLAVALNGSQQENVVILDAADGSFLAERPYPQMMHGSLLNDAAIAWDPSGEPRLAILDQEGSLLVWDWQANAVVWGPLDLREPVTGGELLSSLDWTRDAQGRSILAVGGKNGLMLLDGESGQVTLSLDPSFQVYPVGRISTLDFSPDGEWLGYGYANGVVALRITDGKPSDSIIWPLSFQPHLLTFGPQSAGPRLAVFGPQGVHFVSQDEPNSTPAFEAGYGSLAWGQNDQLYHVSANGMLGIFQDGEDNTIPTQYSDWPELLAWNGNEMLLSLHNDTITSWDTRSGELYAVGTVMAPTPVALAVSADGSRAVFDLGGEFAGQVWDTASNQPLARIEPLDHKVRAGFSADNSRLVTIDRSGMLIVWDAVSGRKIREMQAAPSDTQIDALALSPDGIWAALSRIENGEPRLELWNLESMKVLGMIPLDTNTQSLAWSPDSQRLAEASSGYVTIWDLTNGGLKLQRMGPEPYGIASGTIAVPYVDFIRSLAWSPDGRTIATGGGIVTIWDAESGQPVKAFNGHRGYINDLAYRADGSVLASASNDGTILLWDTSFSSNLAPTATPLMATATPLPYPIETGTPLETATPLAPIQYTVVEGDTCAGIAYTFDVSESSIIAMNGLNADCSDLRVGQMLIIPLPTPISPTATPLAVDLSGYNLYHDEIQSPDARWTGERLLAQPSESSTGQQDYHHLTVRGPAGKVWAYERWTDMQTTRTGWSDLKWTGDAVYWYENVSNLDVCHADWSTNLRRMDLSTGAVTTIPGFGPDWQGRISFSPDSPNFASLEGAELVIRGLDGAEQQRIPFQTIDPNSWGVRAMVYEFGDMGVVMIQHSPANLMCSGGPVREGLVVFDVVNGTALQHEIPEGYAFRGYHIDGLAYLLGPDGKIYQMDMHTGALELAPADVQP